MIERLMEQIEEKNSPIVVGLDPTISMIPTSILEKSVREYGETTKAAADAIYRFNEGILEAVHKEIPAVKPQIAMYESFGSEGVRAYEKTVRLAKEMGLIVIGDAKRGDIGSTSTAYALGHLGSIPFLGTRLRGFDTDFLTINPYMGSDSVLPFVKVCEEEDKGLFILVRTSNPSSTEFQDKSFGERTLYETVADHVLEWAASTRKPNGYSDIGAVVGATYPEEGARLRKRMGKIFFLIPGYGAQGATAKDLRGAFDENGRGAIVNSSRGIIAAWQKENPTPEGAEMYKEAALRAVLAMKKDLGEHIHGL